MSFDTKLGKLLKHMRAGEWEEALRLAGTFHDLGKHKNIIKTAHGAVTNRRFYEQLGRDVDSMIQDGITALKERYSKYEDYDEFISEIKTGRFEEAVRWKDLDESTKKELIKMKYNKLPSDDIRKRLSSWAGRSSFEYSGSVAEGTEIYYGNDFQYKVVVTQKEYKALLNHFRGKDIKIGTSRTSPPAGSLGEWLQSKVNLTAIASYLGPILVNEGYAARNSMYHDRICFLK